MVFPLAGIAAQTFIDHVSEARGAASHNNVAVKAAAASGLLPHGQAGTVQQPEFSQILSGVAGAVVNRLKTAEALSVEKISGADVPIRDVVNSIMEAEQSLTAAIAIRDRIVQAYLEVSRMQI